MTLLYSSTCFGHHVIIMWRSKMYYTAPGIITSVGDRPVNRSLKPRTGRPPIGVKTPDAV